MSALCSFQERLAPGAWRLWCRGSPPPRICAIKLHVHGEVAGRLCDWELVVVVVVGIAKVWTRVCAAPGSAHLVLKILPRAASEGRECSAFAHLHSEKQFAQGTVWSTDVWGFATCPLVELFWWLVHHLPILPENRSHS